MRKTQYSEAVVKLAMTHLEITQNIGFIKYYGNADDEQMEYLNNLEEKLGEVLVLLGYDFNKPFWEDKQLEKENEE
ncbi:hypothetical protein CW670_02690 [Macrococcoides caseolyticum]|uniref:hypothetical protein n=1 Tax=Macrococcoides caseolyticum TaxID=69966 RepID=UPI000C337BA5|nr:hypothetical protein [Macrococcus caseolyticus]PKE36856.1 hypothetical protein CW695_00440 [Macrococcus caseolyticus]PKE75116.1 hypothetical protein CW670_02690 [Macrococcus caseolyticus]